MTPISPNIGLPEDWELISRVYAELYHGEIFYLPQILKLLSDNPELGLINSHVRQKKLGE